MSWLRGAEPARLADAAPRTDDDTTATAGPGRGPAVAVVLDLFTA